MHIEDTKNLQILEGVNRREDFAERLSAHARTPEQVLRVAFNAVMEGLETERKAKCDSAMSHRVWEAISKERLKTLKKTLIDAICVKMLLQFSDDQIKEYMQKDILAPEVLSVYKEKQTFVVSSVIEKAKSMSKELVYRHYKCRQKRGD